MTNWHILHNQYLYAMSSFHWLQMRGWNWNPALASDFYNVVDAEQVHKSTRKPDGSLMYHLMKTKYILHSIFMKTLHLLDARKLIIPSSKNNIHLYST